MVKVTRPCFGLHHLIIDSFTKTAGRQVFLQYSKVHKEHHSDRDLTFNVHFIHVPGHSVAVTGLLFHDLSKRKC